MWKDGECLQYLRKWKAFPPRRFAPRRMQFQDKSLFVCWEAENEKKERGVSDRAITQPFGSDVLFPSQTGLDVSLPLICYCRGWGAGCRSARKLWSAGHDGLLIDSGETYWGELLGFSFPGKTCRWTRNRPVDECSTVGTEAGCRLKEWWYQYPQSETNASEILNLIPSYLNILQVVLNRLSMVSIKWILMPKQTRRLALSI